MTNAIIAPFAGFMRRRWLERRARPPKPLFDPREASDQLRYDLGFVDGRNVRRHS